MFWVLCTHLHIIYAHTYTAKLLSLVLGCTESSVNCWAYVVPWPRTYVTYLFTMVLASSQLTWARSLSQSSLLFRSNEATISCLSSVSFLTGNFMCIQLSLFYKSLQLWGGGSWFYAKVESLETNGWDFWTGRVRESLWGLSFDPLFLSLSENCHDNGFEGQKPYWTTRLPMWKTVWW